jgi:copper homeostasis protein
MRSPNSSATDRPPKILEVIVTSLEEAIEAEAGGADRLELVRSLEQGGLTPPVELVRQVVETVSIPVRVMLRENPSMSLANQSEMMVLQSLTEAIAKLPIDGLVLGFVRGNEIDAVATRELLAAAPHCRATFHRAFEHTLDPLSAIRTLKQMPQIDRILAGGGDGSWLHRKRRLLEWQRAAAPEIEILVGAGVSSGELMNELLADPDFREMHIGRAARIPEEYSGAVLRQQVALLRSASPLQ